MARNYLLILNIINAFLFALIIIVFNSIFSFEDVLTNANGELVIFDIFNSLKNMFVYVFYFILIVVVIMVGFGLSFAFSYVTSFYSNFMGRFIELFFINFLNSWFVFPTGEAPSNLGDVPGLMFSEIAIFSTDLYLLMFQVLFILSIAFAIKALFSNDPKNNLKVIGFLVLMIVIPLMVFGFREMLRLFTLQIPYLEALTNPVDPRLTRLPLNNFFAFFLSPVALLAITCYIYLELAFQINYTDTVTKPSLERSERLETQLTVLRRESILITANAEKIKEEAKLRKQEMGLEEKDSLGKFFTKGGQRLSYVREMIEKRKLEEEEKKLITAASKTRRLGRYIERLFKEDPDAEDTLTAKSSAPEAKGLAISTLTTFTYRVLLLIIISYIIIHPHWFFVNVFNLPPAITESVAMASPEVVITLLIPIILLFPVISQIISYVKHRNLIIRLKQEGRIKDILASVGDYVVQEGQESEKDEEEETPSTTTPTPASTGA